MADPLDPLDNAYTTRDLKYLDSQGLDVMLVARPKSGEKGKVYVRSAGLSPASTVMLLTSLAAATAAPEAEVAPSLTDLEKEKFPRTPGPIEDILKDKLRIQGLASDLMKYWRSTFNLKMGKGKFELWDTFKVDTGAMAHCLDLVEQASSRLGDVFTLRMAQVIEWNDLAGMHGLATGNAKALRVPWSRGCFKKNF